MSQAHKETLAQANLAITKGDFDGFLQRCTDDTVWNFVGDRILKGKPAVRAWMAETYRAPPRFDVEQMVAEGDTVVAVGTIMLTGSDGVEAKSSYCDVWRLRDGKLFELSAYVVSGKN
jgi:ketosteroid isomerase-like protein